MHSKKIGFVIIATCIALAATNVAAQSNSFDGLYKPRGAEYANWDCKTVGQDGGAIAIKNGEVWGVESMCTLNNLVPVNGMSAVLFDADCAGEGSEWTERVMLMNADFGVYYITNSFVAEWQNCAVN